MAASVGCGGTDFFLSWNGICVVCCGPCEEYTRSPGPVCRVQSGTGCRGGVRVETYPRAQVGSRPGACLDPCQGAGWRDAAAAGTAAEAVDAGTGRSLQ